MGLANIYLPGVQHAEKYAVTTHPSTTHEPVKEMRQHKLYEREGNHFVFQMYGQARKKDGEILCMRVPIVSLPVTQMTRV